MSTSYEEKTGIENIIYGCVCGVEFDKTHD